MSENDVKPPVTKEEFLYVLENGTHEEIMKKFNELLKSARPVEFNSLEEELECISSMTKSLKFLNDQETRW